MVSGRIQEAIPLLREAMQTHEAAINKAQNACWLARALEQQGDPASRTFWEEARKLDPDCFLLKRPAFAPSEGRAPAGSASHLS